MGVLVGRCFDHDSLMWLFLSLTFETIELVVIFLLAGCGLEERDLLSSRKGE